MESVKTISFFFNGGDNRKDENAVSFPILTADHRYALIQMSLEYLFLQ